MALDDTIQRLRGLLKLSVDPKIRIPTVSTWEKTIDNLVRELVEHGYYPATSKTGTPADVMVRMYGVDWNVWSKPHFCPNCNADWRNHEAGPPFKNEIAHSSIFDDGVVSYVCPECNVSLSLEAYEKLVRKGE